MQPRKIKFEHEYTPWFDYLSNPQMLRPDRMPIARPTTLQKTYSHFGDTIPSTSKSTSYSRFMAERKKNDESYTKKDWTLACDFEPVKVDQMQLERDAAALSKLSVEINCNLLRRLELDEPQPSVSIAPWNPFTPLPQLFPISDSFTKLSLQKSQSLGAMRKGMEQPDFSVPPLAPIPSTSKQQQLQVQQPLVNVNEEIFDIGYHTIRNHSQIKLPILKLEGSSQYDPATLSLPWGISCDREHQFYVADRGNNRIVIFSPDGSFSGSFGCKGDQPGEFHRPAGLAFDIEGRLVVADKDNHRIQVFKPDGEYLFHFGQNGNKNGEFFYPWDVACSSNGHIAVTDSRNHRVQIFTSLGIFIAKYGWENRQSMLRELDSPRGVIFVKHNVLLITDFNNHRIIQVTFGDIIRMSQFNQTYHPKSALNRPQGLTQDAEGNVLVCDSKNNRIVVFSPNGEFIGEFGRHGKEDGQFDRTADIAVTEDGKIAVVDLHHDRVQIF